MKHHLWTSLFYKSESYLIVPQDSLQVESYPPLQGEKCVYAGVVQVVPIRNQQTSAGIRRHDNLTELTDVTVMCGGNDEIGTNKSSPQFGGTTYLIDHLL